LVKILILDDDVWCLLDHVFVDVGGFKIKLAIIIFLGSLVSNWIL
jgi:hypothetical protein